MRYKYAWSENKDDEIWYGGPCDTIKECVDEALAENFNMTDTFSIGHIEPYEIKYDFAQDIVERLCEDAWDEVGEASEGWLDSAKRAQLDLLNKRITPIIMEWLKEINEEPTFYKILPCEECTLKEAMEIYYGQIKNAPKGGKF